MLRLSGKPLTPALCELHYQAEKELEWEEGVPFATDAPTFESEEDYARYINELGKQYRGD